MVELLNYVTSAMYTFVYKRPKRAFNVFITLMIYASLNHKLSQFMRFDSFYTRVKSLLKHALTDT